MTKLTLVRPGAEIAQLRMAGQAPTLLTTEDCARILADEMDQLAQSDPESFRHFKPETIEQRMAAATVGATRSGSRELAPGGRPTEFLYTQESCRILVPRLVQIMDRAAINLGHIPMENSAKEELYRIIERQHEVIVQAGFLAMRVITQTPDSLNDPQIRDVLHEAAMRKMVQPFGPPDAPAPAPVTLADRERLQLAKHFQPVGSAVASVTQKATALAPWEPSLSYADAIKAMVSIMVMDSYMTLGNDSTLRVISNLKGQYGLGPVHTRLDFEIFPQFRRVFEAANVAMHAQWQPVQKFHEGWHASGGSLSGTYARLYDNVCLFGWERRLSYMKDMLKVIEQFEKARSAGGDAAPELAGAVKRGGRTITHGQD